MKPAFNKFKLTPGKLFAGFLLLAVLLVLINFVSDGRKQPETGATNATSSSDQPADSIDVQLDEATNAELKQETETTPARKVQIFIDVNESHLKEATEKLCEVCISKVLLAGEVLSGIFPKTGKLKEISIASQGSLKDTELADVNTVWGFFDDREIFIEPQVVAVNDGSSDINIYAYETSAIVSGVNANISKFTDFGEGDNGHRVIYGFADLVPSFQAAADEGKDVWLQYIPDSNSPAKYYLAKSILRKDATGSLSGSSGGYYLEVEWNIPSGFENVSRNENLKLFLI